MNILSTKPSAGYELIDSGNGEKLERFGDIVLRRPDPQALWSKELGAEVWDAAHAAFVNSGRSGTWRIGDVVVGTTSGSNSVMTKIPETWQIELAGLSFGISLSAFKHTGIFPEHAENWNWIRETIKAAKAGQNKADATQPAREKISVLNLFGYTGGATIAAAQAGAEVTHVDGSKVSVHRASENAKSSGLSEAPIRWIIDDVMAFVKREIRRGNKYDAIIMDPPAYGHGPKKELWQIETHLPELISECQKLLSDAPLFVLLNGYAAGYSPIAYRNNLADLIGNRGQIEFGELATETKTGRQLPAGIFARWRNI